MYMHINFFCANFFCPHKKYTYSTQHMQALPIATCTIMVSHKVNEGLSLDSLWHKNIEINKLMNPVLC